MKTKKIGVIGCGSIGAALVRAAGKDLSGNIEKIFLWDTDVEKINTLEKEVSVCTVADSLEDLVEKSDLVVEAVSPSVIKDLLRMVIDKNKDLLMMSIGGILGNETLLDEAREKQINILLPSGAIAGVDALKAAKISGVESVTITTRKPPKSIKGAPYFVEKGIDADLIKEETVVYEGTATEAIKAFPKNVNVSALLSLAGIGSEKTKVKIIVSPEFTKNSHEISIKSNAGTITATTSNVPSPENPKTSYLAVLSAISALKGYFDTVRIGA